MRFSTRYPPVLASSLAAGFLFALLMIAARVLAQQGPETPIVAANHSPSVLTGKVVGEDAEPVSGAVVVTSEGGQAVSEADGSFEIEFPPESGAQTVQLTAVANGGSSSLACSRQITSVMPGGMVQIGTLPMTQSSVCLPRWLPTFGGQPGTNDIVHCQVVYDDGSGPALYVGGLFSSAGGVSANRIARWDGTAWSALGSGMNSISSVDAMVVYDDGSGPALYAGGEFTSAGGVNASNIAKWNGTAWLPLGSGVDGKINALAVHNDGTGPALYAGGAFTIAGGASAIRIAKWNGSAWSALGGGMNNIINCLAVHDDGGGPALYAGGGFTIAGGVNASRIAKWNGTAWSALGSGTDSPVLAMVSHDDGSGSALYAGGLFSSAGGVTAFITARWNGTAWSPVGSGFGGSGSVVRTLIVYDDGSGPALCAGGGFNSMGGVSVNNVAKWDGTTWSARGGGIDFGVASLAAYDDGTGPALFAGGFFTTAGGMSASRIAEWNGTTWSALGRGMNSAVSALAVYDDGTGPALFAGGSFTSVGSVNANRIARWDGALWSALGSGMDGNVNALLVHDDGSGPALFVGGAFTTAGGVSASRVAKWNGTTWSALGGGMNSNSSVNALVVYDDGSGPALCAGGNFLGAGGVNANRIAKWNGTLWSAVGTGVSNTVKALVVYDDGGGPALFAGGSFTVAGSVTATCIAKWNGSLWSSLGSGMSSSNSIDALVVHDDGSGQALYAGGSFSGAGAVSARSIARWNGTAWSALGGGLNFVVNSLGVHDDGNGPALFAGGSVWSAGTVSAGRIAEWNGTAWSELGSGTNGSVNALAVHDDGSCSGPALFAGGGFGSAIDSGDSYIAKWGCPTTVAQGAPDCNLNGIPDTCDIAAASSHDANSNGIPDECEVNGGTPYCFGYVGCPCGNNVLSGSKQGCRNATGLGARLVGAGLTQVSADDLLLSVDNLPIPPVGNSFLLYCQGTAQQVLPFQDGKLCVGGTMIRMAIKPYNGSTSAYPGLGEPPVHTRGLVGSTGGVRNYQVWYRTIPMPCGSNSNLSNGLSVIWSP